MRLDRIRFAVLATLLLSDHNVILDLASTRKQCGRK